MNDTNLATNVHTLNPNKVYQPAVILPATQQDLVANADIMATLNELTILKAQIKAMEKVQKGYEDEIKKYMNLHETMLYPDGTEAVTWKTGKPKVSLNAELVKEHFNDVYETCCELKPGSRVFLVK